MQSLSSNLMDKAAVRGLYLLIEDFLISEDIYIQRVMTIECLHKYLLVFQEAHTSVIRLLFFGNSKYKNYHRLAWLSVIL